MAILMILGIASEEDGRRPYALFFCLSWFQKKEKKPDSTPRVYDVDLMNAEQEEDPLDVPEYIAIASQSQPEAGPSRLQESKEHAEAQSS
ncbi:hypothetical protein AZE42_12548 [Rhizopogon vesiculosus]|uniref:Uncharacterized protein n=1 Tax=Rhizopogon vesiculosus TaxID=180088 RepID=A0A1J8QK68_9AGAM|nr:hypothetical protein AZE42_12548 [Rhizopogon vesiculosus]